jgi:hypothetical protein
VLWPLMSPRQLAVPRVSREHSRRGRAVGPTHGPDGPGQATRHGPGASIFFFCTCPAGCWRSGPAVQYGLLTCSTADRASLC